MRTIKIATILVMMCIVTLSAGVVAGTLVVRQPVASPAPSILAGGSPLTDELALTPEQRQQMKQIWESARDTAQTCARQAQSAQHELDQQLIGMLTPEQRDRYAQITRAARDKVDALDAQRQQAFRHAVDRTEQILDADQRRAYEQIIRNRIGTLPGSSTAPFDAPAAQ